MLLCFALFACLLASPHPPPTTVPMLDASEHVAASLAVIFATLAAHGPSLSGRHGSDPHLHYASEQPHGSLHVVAII
jgi:hypothetical protein